MRHGFLPATFSLIVFTLMIPVAEVRGETLWGKLFEAANIQGYNLARCATHNASDYELKEFDDAYHEYTLNESRGAGYQRYEEEAKVAYGTRKQWSFCGGRYAKIGRDKKALLPSRNNAFSYIEGQYLSGDYHPIGVTFLPGSYVAPYLGLIAPLYATIGIGADLFHTREIRYTQDPETFQTVRQEKDAKTSVVTGPEIAVGAQVRLGIVTVFVEMQTMLGLQFPQGRFVKTHTVSLGGGVFFVAL